MTYQEVLKAAREAMGKNCQACPVCNGKACGSRIPGPGAKGVGDTAIRNYEKWQEIRVQMDTISDTASPDTSLELFGKTFRYPFFAGPVGAVAQHYGDKYDDLGYNRVLVRACAQNGIAAFTGDGLDPQVMEGACQTIAEENGSGIPTVKPWDLATVSQKLRLCRDANCFAIAMDIDAAGLPFLKNRIPPAGSKTVEQLKEIIAEAGRPFLIKGVMTPRGAEKALAAGAAGIVVSNHGGRVQDQCPATAEVLTDIVDAVKGSGMKILVDGGIRSGTDIFKALAMGADGVLIARPFVPAVYGGGEEGVKLLIEKLASELADTMTMCGAKDLASITRDMIWAKG